MKTRKQAWEWVNANLRDIDRADRDGERTYHERRLTAHIEQLQAMPLPIDAIAELIDIVNFAYLIGRER